MPCGKCVFDAVLAGQRPVHRRIQVVLITTGHPEHLAQRAGGGLGAQPRANASLEPGPITCAISIAVTRSRQRDGAGSISSSMPSRRALPSTAATCPCGRLRVISNASDRLIAGGGPLTAPCSLSTFGSGARDRLARVRVFTLPPSR